MTRTRPGARRLQHLPSLEPMAKRAKHRPRTDWRHNMQAVVVWLMIIGLVAGIIAVGILAAVNR